jgi:hypothetical protein
VHRVRDQVVEIPMIGAGPSLDVAVPIRSIESAVPDWRPVECAHGVANRDGAEGTQGGVKGRQVRVGG